MNSEWPRAVSTAAVWLAIGYALGAGLFRMNFTGAIAYSILIFLPVLLVGGAVVATKVIWRHPPPSKGDQNAP
jgi:hypothetical protein